MDGGREGRPVVLVAEPQALPGMWLEDVLAALEADGGFALATHGGKHAALAAALDSVSGTWERERPIPPHAKSSLHHLTPKLKGGARAGTVRLHQICHSAIHARFSEAEIAQSWGGDKKMALYVAGLLRRDTNFLWDMDRLITMDRADRTAILMRYRERFAPA